MREMVFFVRHSNQFNSRASVVSRLMVRVGVDPFIKVEFLIHWFFAPSIAPKIFTVGGLQKNNLFRMQRSIRARQRFANVFDDGGKKMSEGGILPLFNFQFSPPWKSGENRSGRTTGTTKKVFHAL